MLMLQTHSYGARAHAEVAWSVLRCRDRAKPFRAGWLCPVPEASTSWPAQIARRSPSS